MIDLVHLSYSPWSERARWALDHHGLAYHSRPYTPMVGELPLRVRLRRFSGRVTVPVLFTRDGAVTDSSDIARYADRTGRGSPLIPEGRERDVAAWVQRADAALEAGRNLVVRRTGMSRAARMESLPPHLRSFGPVSDLLARSGAAFFVRKYGLSSHSEDDDVGVIVETLAALRKALHGRQTLLDQFSFADIVMAGTVQIVAPVSDRFLALGPATRAVWSHPALSDFGDLVNWRDQLYADRRGTRAAA